jgi:hypothetical protein
MSNIQSAIDWLNQYTSVHDNTGFKELGESTKYFIITHSSLEWEESYGRWVTGSGIIWYAHEMGLNE